MAGSPFKMPDKPHETNGSATPDRKKSFVGQSEEKSTDGYASEPADLEQMIPPTTFTRFPNLPKELQLKTWRHAAHEPVRVVLGRKDCDNVYFKFDNSNDSWEKEARWPEDRMDNRIDIQEEEFRIPAIFHACRDSREVAIKECSPRFFQSRPGEPEDMDGNWETVTNSLLKTIKILPLFAKLRYVEMQGSEFDVTGYSQRQSTILKAIPGLEKLTLHGDSGHIMEYYSNTGMRDDETILQFWKKKRGPWALNALLRYRYSQFPKLKKDYAPRYQTFLEAVDDGLFCDTMFMPPAFEAEQNAMIQKLRMGDVDALPVKVKLEDFPSWEEDIRNKIEVLMKSSGIMFSKAVKGKSYWNGFTDQRVDKCRRQAVKAEREETKQMLMMKERKAGLA